MTVELTQPSKTIHMAGPWITEHEVSVVNDAMRNGWYENAYDYCELFQKEFAAYHDRKYAIMTPSCTTALHLLLTALGVSDGDEVIVPECTWIATAAPVKYLRATPVFCDIEADSWCLDPKSAEKAITEKTKAIIAVDLFGNMPRMDELRALSERHGIPLVEDAAEAVGSMYHGQRAGKFGVGSTYSFHRTKTITTGEGGMLLVDDDELYEQCMFLRDHGRRRNSPTYQNEAVTYKYMPFNVQAALGYAQFQRIDELVDRKRWMLHKYQEHLADVPDLQFNAEPDGVKNGVWITAVVLGESHRLDKQQTMDAMQALGLPTRPFFYPLSSLPAFAPAEETYRTRNPTAYDISSRGINLPGALNVTEEQIVAICDGLKQVINDPGRIGKAA